MKIIPIASLRDIDQAAESFLEAMGEARVIAFSGEMGAGKTTFIQAICRKMGVTAEVNSPTFSLVNQYFTPEGHSIFHFDLYRIEDPAELFDMGYEEYFFSGEYCFIEWPEKASHLIPDEALRVEIVVAENESREIQFQPTVSTKN
ncbi:MAG: tRNA (adenosine(37)-N6)-threonylcarbamoyltransferase complex ATPase subunit type 1 TsaE [Bacteroidia bacterium]|nr:MAG: tRNA (adenosine(37)-N6)-threonylcarbamoyltransferase complex ATPase subunit type 1 TsaE [Bacteroidia bacterium]